MPETARGRGKRGAAATATTASSKSNNTATKKGKTAGKKNLKQELSTTSVAPDMGAVPNLLKKDTDDEDDEEEPAYEEVDMLETIGEEEEEEEEEEKPKKGSKGGKSSKASKSKKKDTTASSSGAASSSVLNNLRNKLDAEKDFLNGLGNRDLDGNVSVGLNNSDGKGSSGGGGDSVDGTNSNNPGSTANNNFGGGGLSQYGGLNLLAGTGVNSTGLGSNNFANGSDTPMMTPMHGGVGGVLGTFNGAESARYDAEGNQIFGNVADLNIGGMMNIDNVSNVGSQGQIVPGESKGRSRGTTPKTATPFPNSRFGVDFGPERNFPKFKNINDFHTFCSQSEMSMKKKLKSCRIDEWNELWKEVKNTVYPTLQSSPESGDWVENPNTQFLESQANMDEEMEISADKLDTNKELSTIKEGEEDEDSKKDDDPNGLASLSSKELYRTILCDVATITTTFFHLVDPQDCCCEIPHDLLILFNLLAMYIIVDDDEILKKQGFKTEDESKHLLTEALENAVTKTYEKLIYFEFNNCECFYGVIVVRLLMDALKPTANQSDVLRLLKMKSAFAAIDWDEMNSTYLSRELLKKCYMSPLFLRGSGQGSSEGQRFLEFGLALHPALPFDINSVLMNLIKSCATSTIKTMSKLLFRAWCNLAPPEEKKSGGFGGGLDDFQDQDIQKQNELQHKTATRISLENQIQEWMIFECEAEPVLASKARMLLNEFHQKKHQHGVQDMLCRLYQPIIFRYLSVANWKVRLNATALLAITFPLLQSDYNSKQEEEAIVTQLKVIEEAMVDDVEDVRKVGIQAVARTLATYWEMIPVETVCALFTQLMKHCAKDKKCPQVRVAVIEAFRYLLSECPLCHDTLRVAIKAVGFLIHDKHLSVRGNFCRLLEDVHYKTNWGITNLIDSNALLLRIAEEYKSQTQLVSKIVSGTSTQETKPTNENATGEAGDTAGNGDASNKVKDGTTTSAAGGQQNQGQNDPSILELKKQHNSIGRRLSKLLNSTFFGEETKNDVKKQVERIDLLLSTTPLPCLACFSFMPDIPDSELAKLAASCWLVYTSTPSTLDKFKLAFIGVLLSKLEKSGAINSFKYNKRNHNTTENNDSGKENLSKWLSTTFTDESIAGVLEKRNDLTEDIMKTVSFLEQPGKATKRVFSENIKKKGLIVVASKWNMLGQIIDSLKKDLDNVGKWMVSNCNVGGNTLVPSGGLGGLGGGNQQNTYTLHTDSLRLYQLLLKAPICRDDLYEIKTELIDQCTKLIDNFRLRIDRLKWCMRQRQLSNQAAMKKGGDNPSLQQETSYQNFFPNEDCRGKSKHVCELIFIAMRLLIRLDYKRVEEAENAVQNNNNNAFLVGSSSTNSASSTNFKANECVLNLAKTLVEWGTPSLQEKEKSTAPTPFKGSAQADLQQEELKLNIVPSKEIQPKLEKLLATLTDVKDAIPFLTTICRNTMEYLAIFYSLKQDSGRTVQAIASCGETLWSLVCIWKRHFSEEDGLGDDMIEGSEMDFSSMDLMGNKNTVNTTQRKSLGGLGSGLGTGRRSMGRRSLGGGSVEGGLGSIAGSNMQTPLNEGLNKEDLSTPVIVPATTVQNPLMAALDLLQTWKFLRRCLLKQLRPTAARTFLMVERLFSKIEEMNTEFALTIPETDLKSLWMSLSMKCQYLPVYNQWLNSHIDKDYYLKKRVEMSQEEIQMYKLNKEKAMLKQSSSSPDLINSSPDINGTDILALVNDIRGTNTNEYTKLVDRDLDEIQVDFKTNFSKEVDNETGEKKFTWPQSVTDALFAVVSRFRPLHRVCYFDTIHGKAGPKPKAAANLKKVEYHAGDVGQIDLNSLLEPTAEDGQKGKKSNKRKSLRRKDSDRGEELDQIEGDFPAEQGLSDDENGGNGGKRVKKGGVFDSPSDADKYSKVQHTPGGFADLLQKQEEEDHLMAQSTRKDMCKSTGLGKVKGLRNIIGERILEEGEEEGEEEDDEEVAQPKQLLLEEDEEEEEEKVEDIEMEEEEKDNSKSSKSKSMKTAKAKSKKAAGSKGKKPAKEESDDEMEVDEEEEEVEDKKASKTSMKTSMKAAPKAKSVPKASPKGSKATTSSKGKSAMKKK